ncbi:inorganic phosphate transporter [Dehalococcoides mccartyi]|uniref:inorganic phosphate transporter n=1 Tax=Dehalococcoides mccartyi TaxID=61435 RepID=UPI003395382A
MPDASFIPYLIIILLAIGFAFVNGTNDTANAIATVVGTRVLSPRKAIIMAAAANLVGVFTGTAVARTIGKGILGAESLTYETVIAGLIAAVIWSMVATRKGLPVSLTHCLVAGLAMAGVAMAGVGAVDWGVLLKIVAAVGIAPIMGMAGGYLLMVALLWIFRRSVPSKTHGLFSHLQIFSAAFMAFSHGRSDGQMPMGIIALGTVLYTGNAGLWDAIPIWIIILSALSISAGTAIGGWRVIQTVGVRMTNLRPINGFAAETAAATVIQIAASVGIPVSSTHAISSAIMGVGATRRLSAVRWGVAGNIVSAWLLTFPICGALGFLVAGLFKLIF